MFFITNKKFKNALWANNLIHDAIIMGIFDKYFKEENLENNEFGLLLLGRSLNWAVPGPNYNFEDDLNKIESEDFKIRIKKDENQIFMKGLNILNSDQLLEKLITFYISYEIFLIKRLSPINNEKEYSGINRMNKFLAQTLMSQPNVRAPNFKEEYKKLFIEFNKIYGEYGKVLENKTIESLFSFVF